MAILAESGFAHLVDYVHHAHTLSDIFVPDVVESQEALGQIEHLHLHILEDLLVLVGCWPALGTVQHDWAYDNFVDLALEWYGH